MKLVWQTVPLLLSAAFHGRGTYISLSETFTLNIQPGITAMKEKLFLNIAHKSNEFQEVNWTRFFFICLSLHMANFFECFSPNILMYSGVITLFTFSWHTARATRARNFLEDIVLLFSLSSSVQRKKNNLNSYPFETLLGGR